MSTSAMNWPRLPAKNSRARLASFDRAARSARASDPTPPHVSVAALAPKAAAHDNANAVSAIVRVAMAVLLLRFAPIDPPLTPEIPGHGPYGRWRRRRGTRAAPRLVRMEGPCFRGSPEGGGTKGARPEGLRIMPS